MLKSGQIKSLDKGLITAEFGCIGGPTRYPVQWVSVIRFQHRFGTTAGGRITVRCVFLGGNNGKVKEM